jgi:hypothetical protein
LRPVREARLATLKVPESHNRHLLPILQAFGDAVDTTAKCSFSDGLTNTGILGHLFRNLGLGHVLLLL